MLKDKNIIYVILFSILLLIGLVVIVNNKNEPRPAAPTAARTNAPEPNKSAGLDLIGQQAPSFSLESITGQTINLGDYLGQNVVLFFNEGSMCYPACWNQIQAFAKDERFNNDDTVVFSVVVDTKKQWEKIVNDVPEFLNAQILFDTSKTVSNDYGALSFGSSMHPQTNPGHTYVLIDKNGVIQYIYDDPNMAIRNDLIFAEIAKLNN